MTAKCDTVAIIGVGMIGGSVGQALLLRRLARQVVGIGRNATRLELARDRGAITTYETDLAAGVIHADVVVVCTPVDTIADLVHQVMSHCRDNALITDAGSTKALIVDRIERESPTRRGTFVGSHPLAGSDRAGVQFADATLFEDRLVVITPGQDTPAQAVARTEEFWRDLGARVTRMTAQEHDRAIAATSHVPHAIASILASVTPEAYLPLTSTGWQDTTRVAAGDVELWRQILMQNQASVLNCLREFEKVLSLFTEALERRDEQAVSQFLAAGKNRRDALAD